LIFPFAAKVLGGSGSDEMASAELETDDDYEELDGGDP